MKNNKIKPVGGGKYFTNAIENGYYKIKFYNHDEIKIMLFNGKYFELFKGDTAINEEIESYEKLNVQVSQLEPPVKPANGGQYQSFPVEAQVKPEIAGGWINSKISLPLNGEIVIVPGGIAKYNNGSWYTGMEEPLYQRTIMWEVWCWMPLPEAPDRKQFSV